jgi:hypothetical protein
VSRQRWGTGEIKTNFTHPATNYSAHKTVIYLMRTLLTFLLATFAITNAFGQHTQPIIAFTSDTQEPMWIEKLLLKQDHNLKATEMIFRDVDSLRPSGLFILGDVVSLGRKAKAWKHIDSYLKQCTADHIPVYATLGNHEVMFNTKRGTQNFRLRFPMYNPAGYSEVIDSVAVVLVNSNFAKMSTAEILAQDNWYQATIRKLDADASIKFIVVGCHHSPYTNSKIVKPSMPVRQNFLPAFINSKKCVLFLSGHSHNFERFNQQGKTFMVIGGGGGLHQPLVTNPVTPDLSANYKPSFHYLEVRRTGNSLQLVSRRLKPDFSGFVDGAVFEVK